MTPATNSIYQARGRRLDNAPNPGPTTVETRSIETVDNDHCPLLLINANTQR